MNAAIDRDVARLDPIWLERFRTDIVHDTRVEDGLVLKAWVIGVAVFFLVLVHRLLS